MKINTAVVVSFVSATAAAPTNQKRSTVYGFDISHYQSSVDFDAAYNDGGLRFVYVKATEGTDYLHSPITTRVLLMLDSYVADIISLMEMRAQLTRLTSSSKMEAVGMLDLEGDCASVDWIQEFFDAYHDKTGRYPVLYSSPSWWEECTDNSEAFVDTNPLNMACWNSDPCTPQGNWRYYTFWQYADSNNYSGDSDVFNGDMTQLTKLASG